MTEPPESDSAHLDLRVLGALELHSTQKVDVRDLKAHPKIVAVLVYLVLEGKGEGVSRDRIASVFWPEADAEHARGALRQCLSVLRRILGPEALVSEGRHYVGVSAAHVECDAARFETLLVADRYREGLDLYRGDLLDGFHVRGSHGWDDWLEGQRVHYRTWAAKGAWALAESSEEKKDLADAAFWSKRALSFTPQNEIEVRRLMRMLDRIGDGVGAMRAFRGLERWLEDELGMPPSPETRQVAEAIRERAGGATSVAVPRRQAADRRSDDSRRAKGLGPTGTERRSGTGRRSEDRRRSGQDRRSFED